jgi:succinate-acetate transporter protein
MSYATILIPTSGIITAYAGEPVELENALGIFLITWFMVTFLFL